MVLRKEWADLLEDYLWSYSYSRLTKALRYERSIKEIYPTDERVFEAFNSCPPCKVKVVIIGQDPYHTLGTANGLAFSVNDGQGFPPSLLNIFKELKDDLGYDEPNSGDLHKWAQEGVLLMNSVLTVEAGQAGSHKDKGWEIFVEEILTLLNKSRQPIVFMLWGSDAIEKETFITNSRHAVLKSTHPSPFSAHKNTSKAVAFLGSRPFSQANKYLIKFNIKPVDWNLNSEDND